MSILRYYKKAECDEHGVPLDWLRCRACGGDGKVDGVTTRERMFTCPDCDGHGSLKAAALEYKLRRVPQTCLQHGGPIRCEDCGHPMSDGTLEGTRLPQSNRTVADDEAWALRKLREGHEPVYPNGIVEQVHYSRCDEKCKHRGPGRLDFEGDTGWKLTDEVDPKTAGVVITEASWRRVDVRTLDWPHDLRPESLAVLCLRCYSERKEIE